MKDTIKITSLAPNKDLFPFIESFWMIQNEGDKDQELATFPDGGIDLYFFHSEQYPFVGSLVGLETGAQVGVMPANSILLGVRLKLLASEYLLKTSVAEIINDTRSIENGFADIKQADLFCFSTFCEKLSIYFLSMLTSPIDPRKKVMSELIYQTNGAISVAEISQASHWSSRQINRYFNKWLGLPMKNYCDILRFRHSFESLKEGNLYPEDGFNDQSHFIRLIKKYSHLTPKQLSQDKDDRFVQLSS